MNVQIIFTTSNTGDFVGILEYLESKGIKPGVTMPSPGTGNGKSVWEASPAVIAARGAGITRIKPAQGETPHQAAMRRLEAAGFPVDGFPRDWQPEAGTDAAWSDDGGANDGVALTPGMDDSDL